MALYTHDERTLGKHARARKARGRQVCVWCSEQKAHRAARSAFSIVCNAENSHSRSVAELCGIGQKFINTNKLQQQKTKKPIHGTLQPAHNYTSNMIYCYEVPVILCKFHCLYFRVPQFDTQPISHISPLGPRYRQRPLERTEPSGDLM